MTETIKSLLLQFLVFPFGSFAFYYCLFSLRAPFPTFVFGTTEALVASIIAGFFTWLALNKWHGIRHIGSELTVAGRIKFEDGKKAVISGRVKAKGPLLEAPCSGIQCVAYRYKASHRHTTKRRDQGRLETRSQWLADYRGYAMTPSVVRGAMKSVSILAEPDCIKYPEGGGYDTEIQGSNAKDRLLRYLEKADFGEEVNDRLEGRNAKTKESRLGPGHFHVDTCAENPDTISNTHKLREMVITKGDTVVISGIYYADKNGIGPGPNSTLEPLQITMGGDAALQSKKAGYQKSMKISFSLAALTCIIYFVVFVYLQG